jgi:hypothetical protein
MNNANKLSKLKIYFLLLTIFSVGTISSLNHTTNANAITKDAPNTNSNELTNVFNCISQKVNKNAKFSLSDAFVCYDSQLKGASKFADQPFQNPDLSNLNRIQPVSDTTPTKTSADKIGETSSSSSSPSKTLNGKTLGGDSGMGSSSSSPSKTLNSNIGKDLGTKLNWNPFDEIGKTKSSLKPKIRNGDEGGIRIKQVSSNAPSDINSVKRPTDPFSAAENKPIDNNSVKRPTDPFSAAENKPIDNNSVKRPTDPFSATPKSKNPSKSQTASLPDITSAIGDFDLPFASILPQ